MNKQERLKLYQTIDKWLETSAFNIEQSNAIRSLLQTLKQAENKEIYNNFILRLEKDIKENESF